MATHETFQASQTTSTSNAQTLNPERRRFLRLLGVSGTAMAVGQVPFSQASLTHSIEKPIQTTKPEVPRYRETEHIRAFYATLD